jgi:uncharacterized protein (DUF1501 family)
MSMTRRTFMQAAAAAGCLSPFAGITRLAHGAVATDVPLLVTVFLRGGADGLQLVGPSADADYIAARPPELRVPDTGASAGFLLDHSLQAAAGFRLHPNAAALAELYHGRQLAIVHAAGIRDGTRSHFVAQDLIERGLTDEKRITTTPTGWLGRTLTERPEAIPGFSATGMPVAALRGVNRAFSSPDLASGLGVPWGSQTTNLLRTLSMTGNSAAHRASLVTLDLLDTVEQRIAKDASGKWLPYTPAGKARYDTVGDLARPLTALARLARMDVGLRVACVEHGGWDTHEGQSGRLANQVRQLSAGLAAFHEDMSAAGHPTIIVVMTEFGRRLRANKSGGTDHGHGACWLLLGPTVRGGRMYGEWPGLSTPALDQGVDLAVTTDYRQILTEALRATQLLASRASPASESALFPGWQAGKPLGLFI